MRDDATDSTLRSRRASTSRPGSAGEARLSESTTRSAAETTAAMAAESRDEDTGRHVQRMSLYCRVLGVGGGMGTHEADTLMSGATMHDIGKLARLSMFLAKA